MSLHEEEAVNLEVARHMLGLRRPCGCGPSPSCVRCGGTGIEVMRLGRNYMTALKRAMGIRGRYFFIADVRRWLRQHPEFDGKRATSGSRDTWRTLLSEARPCVERAGEASLLDRIERKLAA